jgi:dipeptidyl aminopeptidase/acylaminoacyl peptidase
MKPLWLFVIFICSSAHSQNGKIINQSGFTFPDSTIQKIEKLIPDLQTIISTVSFYHITYLSDNLKVKGYLAIPKGEGKYPAIIYNRGGRNEVGKITDQYFLTELGPLCSKGYVIIASQYRGNDGGDGKEEYGGQDVNDILNLLPALATIDKADTSRIGMYGWSRGGMMTYLALARIKNIKAAVVKSGLADLIKLREIRPELDSTMYGTLIPDYSKNKITALQNRSAIFFADKINKQTPLLILQGSADALVPSDQVVNLVDTLLRLRHPVRFILYEGGTHGLIEFRSDYYDQMVSWFNSYLRDRKTWPNLEPHTNQ